jgi:putative Ca2+/H+ antiporter (TMEM165/GDT1 family)
VAELGDKTQLAVMGLASRGSSLLPVFLGGALALTVVTGLAVVGGQQLCRLVPRQKMLTFAAVLFVAMGLLMVTGVI